MTLREKVYDALKSDTTLNALGITADSLYPDWTADSPTQSRFVILRWGSMLPGVGAARPIELAIWAYDREPDYANIDRVLRRSEMVLESLVAQPTGDGWVIDAKWTGASPDLKDDVYNAVVRNESYSIVASGI